MHLEEYTSICRLKSNEDYLPCINEDDMLKKIMQL